MYQKFVCSGTVISAPVVANGEVSFYMHNSHQFYDASNVLQTIVALILVHVPDAKVGEMIMNKVCKNARISVSGRLIGTEKGNPAIYKDDKGKDWTALEVSCYKPIILGMAHKDEIAEDMMSLIFMGRLGRDPEMRYTPSGKAVTNMSVASDYMYRDGTAGQVKETIWWKVSLWERQAETANEFLKKGRAVLIEGMPVIDPDTGGWRLFDRNDGTKGASFEVRGTQAKFVTPRSEEPAMPDQRPADESNEDTTIPF